MGNCDGRSKSCGMLLWRAMMSESMPPLSESGLGRREEILARAIAEAGRCRRRRIARKVGHSCVLVGGAIGVALVWQRGVTVPTPAGIAIGPPASAPSQ